MTTLRPPIGLSRFVSPVGVGGAEEANSYTTETEPDMDLTRELLLPYQGLNGFDGLCHIRVYEQPGRLPVVIAGGLDDNPGTSITNAIEMLATPSSAACSPTDASST